MITGSIFQFTGPMIVENFKDRLGSIEAMLGQTSAGDRRNLRRILADIRQQVEGGTGADGLLRRISGFEKKVRRSVEACRKRIERLPRPNYNTSLPIYACREKILEAIAANTVTIISGETGSGKTTQIPQFCLEAGRGAAGMIGCTQPRRIAAVTVAQRIAEELGAAKDGPVGYKIRFSDRTGKDTRIKIMTDGILLAEARSDAFLDAYDTIIVDEAHERSLNIDFILGILKTLLHRRRDLKLIITSATIDTEKFSRAFDEAPVLEVSGRLYPVEIRYSEASAAESGEEKTPVEAATAAAEAIFRRSRVGDILVFMPTEQDIRESCEQLRGRELAGCEVLPLFARLPAAEQRKVFRQGRGRKIVVATNVAETSITIPSIRYVVDTGLARIPRYLPRTRTTAMPVAPVSRSSADQRAGRCGRVQNGVCHRLYTEEDYLSRPRFTPPEILRANLAEVILRMLDLDLGDIDRFPFIDPPAAASIQDGYRLLMELGAIEQSTPRRQDLGPRRSRYALTQRGRLMASLPLDPRLSRMLIEAEKEGCPGEVLVIAAALSIADPRERPAERAAEADAAHGRYHHPASDFITLLNLWRAFSEARQTMGTGQLKRFCREHFLSYVRMREWVDLHRQLQEEAVEAGIIGSAPGGRIFSEPLDEKRYAAIHRAVASGFLSGIAVRKEKQIYRAARGREAMLFPGSALFSDPPEWIVAAEMVETSRLFARTAARIDRQWLEALGGELCRRTYLHPRWEKNRGQVTATEQVSLFGLIVVEGRTVPYGKIDPAEASDLFVQGALAEEQVKRPFPFLVHNRGLIDEIRKAEDKFRRRDLLVSDAEIFSFYRDRVPETISDVRSFSRFLKKQGGDGFLRMTKEDLLLKAPDPEALSHYPDRIDVAGRRLEVFYRFAPGAEEDGVTVRIPASHASEVPVEPLDWKVPGLLREKVSALIRGLPKIYRRHLVPVADTVEVVLKEMPKSEGPLVTALADFIYRRYGVEVPSTAWPGQEIPEHLKMRFSVVGPRGEELRAGRDRSVLAGGDHVRIDALEEVRSRWERRGIEDWDFEELPKEIFIPSGRDSAWAVFPGLEADKGAVNLKLFTSRGEALQAHLGGVAALYRKCYAKDLKFFRRQIALPGPTARKATVLGGAGRLEEQIFEKTFTSLFAKDIRTAEAFRAHREVAAPGLFEQGQRLLAAVVPVVEAVSAARTLLAELEQKSAQRPKILAFLQDLRRELSALVPDHFVHLYDEARMTHLPRYVKALSLRARRGIDHLEKDRVKAEAVRPFTDGLEELLAALSPASSKEKQRAVEEFFWMLQEYKVSVFAQELGTADPVSKQKLETRLGEARRMA
jgi:ATP-dependent helicase HrpA